MYLVLAIILGLFWAVRLSANSIRTQKFDREYKEQLEQNRAREAVWLAQVINADVENELEYKIYHRDEALLNELKESWHIYYDREFPSIILHNNAKYPEHFVYDGSLDSITDYDCLRMLMCNRGYLTRNDAELGIKVIILNSVPELEARKRWEAISKFICAVDKSLRKKGAGEAIYFEITPNRYMSFGEVNRCNNFRGLSGKIIWRPVIPSFSLDISNRERGTNYM